MLSRIIVEELSDKDIDENSYFFGNLIRIKANADKRGDEKRALDENTFIESLHVETVSGVSVVALAITDKLSHIAGKILA